MQILHSMRSPNKLPIALTIGNFDGVHIGHQAILKQLRAISKQQQLSPAVMTFSPHVQALLGRCYNYLISSDEEKAKIIQTFGIKMLFQIPFNKVFSQIHANDFIDLLIHTLNVKFLLVGDDFRFGYQGEGNFRLLAKSCKKHHVTLQHTSTICYGGHRVSSSRIRIAIKNADFNIVSTLLNRRLRYSGEVVTDKQLGRTINFPTANIRLSESQLLPHGVFAVKAMITGESTVYHGMCNIGSKPTIGESQRQIETHLFDFSRDLYGENLIIEPIKRIRDEKKFDSVNALAKQLQQDKQASITILGLSKLT